MTEHRLLPGPPCSGYAGPGTLPQESAAVPCHGPASFPCLSSSGCQSSGSQNAPFLWFSNIFTQGKRPLTLLWCRDPGGIVTLQEVWGDLPSTLLLDANLLCLEPGDQGVSGSLKGLSEPWLAIGCPVSLEKLSLTHRWPLVLKGQQGA